MKNGPLEAEIQNNIALVSGKNAITLYNKGYYGSPTDEGLILNGFEALHLFELGRIFIKKNGIKLTEEQTVGHFSEYESKFTLRYLVYKDLRNRGYVVNTGEGSSFFFRLYERGDIPKKDGATYYITPLQEGGSIKLSELENLEKLSQQSQKKLVFGMVDALGDVSYLNVTKMEPDDQSEIKEFSDLSSWSWREAMEEYHS